MDIVFSALSMKFSNASMYSFDVGLIRKICDGFSPAYCIHRMASLLKIFFPILLFIVILLYIMPFFYKVGKVLFSITFLDKTAKGVSLY